MSAEHIHYSNVVYFPYWVVVLAPFDSLVEPALEWT